ncbi:hypothetical protein [Thalassobium sp. R2A62]|uniref:hypothetical protein n=1 Tax=Thalassobium sp. R2A62 TaxID=633131 RepID=UPI0002F47880|nr:hypothetical protein [Thalassobium sp. R2A62]
MDHTFREEDRVVIAELHGVGPFRGTVIQADVEQVKVGVPVDLIDFRHDPTANTVLSMLMVCRGAKYDINLPKLKGTTSSARDRKTVQV